MAHKAQAVAQGRVNQEAHHAAAIDPRHLPGGRTSEELFHDEPRVFAVDTAGTEGNRLREGRPQADVTHGDFMAAANAHGQYENQPLPAVPKVMARVHQSRGRARAQAAGEQRRVESSIDTSKYKVVHATLYISANDRGTTRYNWRVDELGNVLPARHPGAHGKMVSATLTEGVAGDKIRIGIPKNGGDPIVLSETLITGNANKRARRS